jgi:DNA-binding transcriptional ArsR family regulator
MEHKVITDERALLYKAFSHPTRLAIYEIMLKNLGRTYTVSELQEELREYGIFQEYVRIRHHLEMMVKGNIVEHIKHKRRPDEFKLIKKVELKVEDLE